MRFIAGFILLLSFVPLGGYIFIKGYPYRLYSGWVENQNWNKFYKLDKFSTLYLAASAMDNISEHSEDYPQLWKTFPFANALVPLPTRHPLFQTVPLLEYTGKSSPPVLGMILAGPDKKEISRFYSLPTRMIEDFTQGQELFKLPFVRNKILKMSPDDIWKEVFKRKIEVKSKSLDEMIQDLYILHIRSKMLPAEIVKYGILKDSMAILELNSKDRDYIVEMVLHQSNGGIYSFVLRTARNNAESVKLRSKFLNTLTFSSTDTGLGRILYTEFKQLNFARQVDQEGLLYLLSAWSQQIDKVELLKEMIFFLERGRSNTSQLRALYQYAYKKYGKTFATKNIFTDTDDQNLLLQRNIELEEIEKKQAIDKAALNRPAPMVELTKEEKMKGELKKAKESVSENTEDITVH